jgi:predicted transcriptional regulator
MSEKTKVSYYVAAPVAKAIKMLAAREERTQSEVAEQALESYLSERQEDLDWHSAAAGAFEFWENPADAAYDEV